MKIPDAVTSSALACIAFDCITIIFSIISLDKTRKMTSLTANKTICYILTVFYRNSFYINAFYCFFFLVA